MAATVAVALLLVSTPVRGQELDLVRRIEALEREVLELKQLVRHLRGDSAVTVPSTAHVPFGSPGGSCTPLVRVHYVACHDSSTRLTRWVSYRLTREELALDSAVRTDNFRPDPELPAGARAELGDYRGSGYDRGHLAPAADFKRSREAMSSTFLLSNIAPQSPTLNRGMWALLEDQVRQLTRRHGRVWVITGTAVLGSEGWSPNAPRQIGMNRVTVPTHFFKVVLCAHGDGGMEVFAFLVPNSLEPPYFLIDGYRVSVDIIERLLDLDLFSELPDEQEEALEATLSPAWPVPEFESNAA